MNDPLSRFFSDGGGTSVHRLGIEFCIVFVIGYFIRDQFTFLAKVNIRVKIFSVCNLHLMENSKFLKHFT